MQRKDLLEIKKRFKKNECTFTRMSGCYVNAAKEKVVKLNEVFLNLPQEEYYKYLEIAKKVLSGTMGNNLLELEFPKETEQAVGKQQFFLGLRGSGLKEEGLLERFYDLVIEHYDYVGNYLILLFHDAYDVMTKTEDNLKLDESEEVYEYVICAICPVTLSKPGLGYIEEENKIGVRLRDWIVAAPENGFLFPAFTQRSSDIDALLYYTKNAKESHEAFMENALGVGAKRTSLQQKKSFENVIKKAAMETGVESEEVFITLQESICDMLDQQEAVGDKNDQPIVLTTDTIKTIVTESGLNETLAPKLQSAFEEEFGQALPTAQAILDTRALAKNELKKKEERLVSEVETLKEALAQVKTPDQQTDLVDPQTGEVVSSVASGEEADDDAASPAALRLPEDATQASATKASALCDVFLRVKPEKATRITSQVINGQKCIIIPVEDGDDIDINGIKMD